MPQRRRVSMFTQTRWGRRSLAATLALTAISAVTASLASLAASPLPASANGGPAVTLVSPASARDREVISITVSDLDLSSDPTVTLICGASQLSAPVIRRSGDASGGTVDVWVPDFDWSTVDSSSVNFPLSYADFMTALNAAGSLTCDVQVVRSPSASVSATAGFTYKPPTMFENGILRSGGCGAGQPDAGIVAMSSVMPWGTLAQPAYKNANGNWYTLTYDDSDSCDDYEHGIYGSPEVNYPLDLALGSDTGGGNWHDSYVFDSDQATPSRNGDLAIEAVNMHLDASNFTVTRAIDGIALGYGTMTVSGSVMTGPGGAIELAVQHEYVLGQTAQFFKITTTVTNPSQSAVTNVNLWVGTRDDYVGSNDDPKKTRGNIAAGAFTAITAMTDPSRAILIQESETDSAGILFYSTTENARSVVDTCCSYSNVFNQDPDTSPVTTTYQDGSYGMYLPVGTLAAGASVPIVWYYAAGNIDDLADVVAEVSVDSGGGPPPPAQPPSQSPVVPDLSTISIPSTDTTTAPTTTTTAPTTTTTVPTPVPTEDGPLPTLTPGVSQVLDNGIAVNVEVFVDNETDLVLEGDDFELRLAGQCTGSCTIQTGTDGRQVLTLEREGLARVEGAGFQPGTPVYVWLFSTPTFLGELTVNPDGSFTGSVPIGDITEGEHTLQVNGTSADGLPRTANLGVVVNPAQAPTPEPTTLPATGTGTTLWITALALLAIGIITTSRRRTTN